jgi:hypothetical protein
VGKKKKGNARTDARQLGGAVVEVRDGAATAISSDVSVINLILGCNEARA